MAIDEVDPQIQIAFAHEGSAQPSDNLALVPHCAFEESLVLARKSEHRGRR
eukprot:CAMPEP_0179446178 /NCGR_PEP_ID=MMETSP0799-20121207/29592_1 /TAXON_ID=46947 /ORGANISM="Geminigera cryophila, Strain CCMP2564" /LENGTH=50 /DNA_ID=CAMNT_0021234897 /DNA_START=388 /DNA_END=537 /DNA_ORIENTATION=-